MKNKNHKQHHLTVHQRIERLSHHNIVLMGIVFFMLLGFVKYEVRLLGLFHEFYGQGYGMLSNYYPHHDEVTRMPIQYGSSMRSATISGE
jgi:hypothetical protein